MTDWFARPLLDLGAVDLDGAPRVEYLLCQRFRYEYDVPAYRRAPAPRRSVPPHGRPRQSLPRWPSAHHVRSVGGDRCGRAAPVRRSRVDRRGNTVVDVHVPEVHCTVEFTVAAVVHRDGPLGDTPLPAASLRDPAHLRPTALTRPDDAPCRRWPPRCRAATADDVEFAEVACSVVQAGIEYGFGATSVETTAAEAWAIGRGVCQDSAHVLLADLPRRRRAGAVRLGPPARSARRQPRVGRGARRRRRRRRERSASTRRTAVAPGPATCRSPSGATTPTWRRRRGRTTARRAAG